MNSSTAPTLDGFDKLFEHRVRLAICTLLTQTDIMSFSRFKELLDATDGNLGAQLRKLEDAGYVTATKQFEDRKPITWYRLTRDGRAALEQHVEALHRLTAGLTPSD